MPHNPIPGHDNHHDEPVMVEPTSAKKHPTRPTAAHTNATDSDPHSWQHDDRVGFALAGVMVALVLVAAWAAHRND